LPWVPWRGHGSVLKRLTRNGRKTSHVKSRPIKETLQKKTPKIRTSKVNE